MNFDIYSRCWFKPFKTFKSFKTIPDYPRRLERLERMERIERAERGFLRLCGRTLRPPRCVSIMVGFGPRKSAQAAEKARKPC
jgi:hypothetical protein